MKIWNMYKNEYRSINMIHETYCEFFGILCCIFKWL